MKLTILPSLLTLALVLVAPHSQAGWLCSPTGNTDFDVNAGIYCSVRELSDGTVSCANSLSTGPSAGFGPWVAQVAIDPTGRPFAIRAGQLVSVIGMSSPGDEPETIGQERNVIAFPGCVEDLMIAGVPALRESGALGLIQRGEIFLLGCDGNLLHLASNPLRWVNISSGTLFHSIVTVPGPTNGLELYGIDFDLEEWKIDVGGNHQSIGMVGNQADPLPITRVTDAPFLDAATLDTCDTNSAECYATGFVYGHKFFWQGSEPYISALGTPTRSGSAQRIWMHSTLSPENNLWPAIDPAFGQTWVPDPNSELVGVSTVVYDQNFIQHLRRPRNYDLVDILPGPRTLSGAPHITHQLYARDVFTGICEYESVYRSGLGQEPNIFAAPDGVYLNPTDPSTTSNGKCATDLLCTVDMRRGLDAAELPGIPGDPVRAYSLKSGYHVSVSQAFETAALSYVGSDVRARVFVPADPANPWWVGDASLTMSIPAAGIYNTQVGTVDLTPLQRGTWVNIEFDLPAAIVAALEGDFPAAKLELASNVSTSNENPVLISDLYFDGTLSQNLFAPNSPRVTSYVPTTPVLSFELGQWTASSGTTIELDLIEKMDGQYSLSVIGGGWQELLSPTFDAWELGDVTSTFSVDVFVPNPLTNPWWAGSLQLYASCPDRLWGDYIDQVDLITLFPGRWNSVRFTLSERISDALSEVDGCSLKFALNTPAEAGRFRLDRMGFVE